MPFVYNPGVPTGTVDLDTDYFNLQSNFQQLNVVYGVDHLPFSNATAQLGYHTDIHFVPVTSPPPVTTAGYGQLYTQTVDGDQQLYYLSGNGLNTKLTGPVAPSIGTSGYTVLPGGLIMQWGTQSVSLNTVSSANVTYPIAFPTAVFSIQGTFSYTSGTDPTTSSSLTVKNFDLTKFRYTSINNSTTTNAFYWIAIGN